MVAAPLRVRRESLLRTPWPASPVTGLGEDNSQLLCQLCPLRGVRLYRTALNRVRESRSYLVPMFTGIVRERGRIVSFDDERLVVSAAAEAEIGDSIAIAGVCLTVVERGGGTLAFDVVGETLERTTLGRKGAGDEVNVEPALRAGEPLGGHIVQGHVDGVGSFRGEADGLSWFDDHPRPRPLLRREGLDRSRWTSLTVAALDERGFAVALVPHTLEATTLGALAPGDGVNLEVDVIAKYVERLTMAK